MKKKELRILETLNLSTCADSSTNTNKSEEKKKEKQGHVSPVTVTCHLTPVTCHLSPVTCHLSHVYESPRMLSEAAEGDLLIPRVKIHTFPLKKSKFMQFKEEPL